MYRWLEDKMVSVLDEWISRRVCSQSSLPAYLININMLNTFRCQWDTLYMIVINKKRRLDLNCKDTGYFYESRQELLLFLFYMLNGEEENKRKLEIFPIIQILRGINKIVNVLESEKLFFFFFG